MFDVTRHWHVACALGVIPFKVKAAVSFAIPIGADLEVFFRVEMT